MSAEEKSLSAEVLIGKNRKVRCLSQLRDDDGKEIKVKFEKVLPVIEVGMQGGGFVLYFGETCIEVTTCAFDSVELALAFLNDREGQ